MAKIKIKLSGQLDGRKVFVNDVQGRLREDVARYVLKSDITYRLEIPVRAPGHTKWTYAVEAEPGYSILPKALNKTVQKKTMPGTGRDVVSRSFKVEEA